MSKPRILLFDIETSHNVVAAFSLFSKTPTPHTNVLKESYIICASWKLLGENKIESVSVLDAPDRFGQNPNDDYHVVITLHGVLSSVDAVVAHYGDEFDIKKLNSRIAYYGLSPLPNFIQIDTRKIAKKKFLFNSNKLDYLGRFLGVGRKIRTEPELWLRCLEGHVESIKRMVRYNKGDIVLLERVYKKLVPFVSSKVNHQLFNSKEVCPSCGGKVHFRGYAYTRANKYRRFQCIRCGHWDRVHKPEPRG